MRDTTMLFGFLALTILPYGCGPAFTRCRSTVSIHTMDTGTSQPSCNEASRRFIVISCWVWPNVNNTNGKLTIERVLLTDGNQLTLDFPLRAYWMIWTPALGTQHIAPRPAVAVFHADYPLTWAICYSPDGFCCGRPATQCEFAVRLTTTTAIPGRDGLVAYEAQRFLDEFLAQKKALIRYMDNCKELTEADKTMVMEKLEHAASRYGIGIHN